MGAKSEAANALAEATPEQTPEAPAALTEAEADAVLGDTGQEIDPLDDELSNLPENFGQDALSGIDEDDPFSDMPATQEPAPKVEETKEPEKPVEEAVVEKGKEEPVTKTEDPEKPKEGDEDEDSEPMIGLTLAQYEALLSGSPITPPEAVGAALVSEGANTQAALTEGQAPAPEVPVPTPVQAAPAAPFQVPTLPPLELSDALYDRIGVVDREAFGEVMNHVRETTAAGVIQSMQQTFDSQVMPRMAEMYPFLRAADMVTDALPEMEDFPLVVTTAMRTVRADNPNIKPKALAKAAIAQINTAMKKGERKAKEAQTKPKAVQEPKGRFATRAAPASNTGKVSPQSEPELTPAQRAAKAIVQGSTQDSDGDFDGF